jgi:hypothetical protein
MAGKIIQICPPRLYRFSAVSTSATFVLKQGIDVSGWRLVALNVRVHSLTVDPVAGLKGQFSVYAQREGRTPNDPAKLFAQPDRLGLIALDYTTVTTNSGAGPDFFVSDLGSNLGSMIRVMLDASNMNGGSPVGTLSVDLCLKNH